MFKHGGNRIRTALLALALAWPAAAHAEDPAWRTGAALLGTAKYPAGFKQFDYVNPAAPKG
ncbi:hypothetical protein J8J27_29935, partial [Mycobacterium tuberculosis]|nr:hypothetical protein [Mycobacterium tuberculosis]